MRESSYDRDLNNAMERHFSVGQDDEGQPDQFGEQLAYGVGLVLLAKDQHISRLQEAIRNLGQIDGGAYNRICLAHSLDPSTLELL